MSVHPMPAYTSGDGRFKLFDIRVIKILVVKSLLKIVLLTHDETLEKWIRNITGTLTTYQQMRTSLIFVSYTRGLDFCV
jgi:hypothetical protein